MMKIKNIYSSHVLDFGLVKRIDEITNLNESSEVLLFITLEVIEKRQSILVSNIYRFGVIILEVSTR